jgi:hypothetical protein
LFHDPYEVILPKATLHVVNSYKVVWTDLFCSYYS